MTIQVLLADDHQLFREGLRALLHATPDIRVAGEAATGYEAVDAVPRCLPDIVVMDIAMPELNGLDAARMICDRRPQTRTLMLSMHTTIEHVHRAFVAGAWGYVLKESASSEAVAAIRQIHAGARYVSRAIRERLASMGTQPFPESSPLDRLTRRERQVLQLIAEGRTHAEIGSLIHISPKSVETYRARILQKLGLEGTAALIRFAVEHDLTGPL